MKRHPVCKFDIETEKEICRLYKEGPHNGCPTLAKRFKCNQATINKILRAYGAKIRSCSESVTGIWVGKKHPNAKNGTFHSAGYQLRWRNGKLHLDHRLIMAAHLGRELDRKEIVHHINGDPKDNRIENLEIMTQSEHMKLHNRTREHLPNGHFASSSE